VSYITGRLLTLQLFKNSKDTREKLRLNFHSLSVSELLEYGRKSLCCREHISWTYNSSLLLRTDRISTYPMNFIVPVQPLSPISVIHECSSSTYMHISSFCCSLLP
jgi:hypothetical protein